MATSDNQCKTEIFTVNLSRQYEKYYPKYVLDLSDDIQGTSPSLQVEQYKLCIWALCKIVIICPVTW